MIARWLLPLLLIAAACQAPASTPPTLGPELTIPPAPDTATDLPLQRPTLPPTWTPISLPTEIVTLSPVWPTATLFLPRSTVPVTCDSFTADMQRSQIEFELGQSPTAAWTQVEGAVQYRLILASASGRIVRDDIYITETSYRFDAELFAAGELYGWSVYPIDAAGDQMCYARGLELIPIVIRE